MGDDEYHPIEHKGSNLTTAGGIGYTVVDSIDTMIIMGLDEEYERAKEWVEKEMSFERDANFNTFEVRVAHRILHTYSGGLTWTLCCIDHYTSSRRPSFSIPSHRRPTFLDSRKRTR